MADRDSAAHTERLERTAGRVRCRGLVRDDTGVTRQCRKTTLHPSGYCAVHCDSTRHRRECTHPEPKPGKREAGA